MQPNSVKGGKLKKQGPSANQAYFAAAAPATLAKDQQITVAMIKPVGEKAIRQLQKRTK